MQVSSAMEISGPSGSWRQEGLASSGGSLPGQSSFVSLLLKLPVRPRRAAGSADTEASGEWRGWGGAEGQEGECPVPSLQSGRG